MPFVCLHMQSLFDIRNQYISTLSHLYPKDEISMLFHIAVEDVLGYRPTLISLKLHDNLDEIHTTDLLHILEDLKSHKPIQYIIGKAPFYGMGLFVNEHTLIPRPETEELVDMIIKNHHNRENLTILDIGTGSGCIAIALAKNLKNAQVEAIDVSEKALEVARQNMSNQQVSVDFKHKDITQWPILFNTIEQYDIIVSNPPYVKEDEKSAISLNVLHFEPHNALFVDNDNPLVFYDHITSMASKHLLPQGSLYFEINQYLAKETAELIEKKGFSKVIIIEDINHAPRMIHARKQ